MSDYSEHLVQVNRLLREMHEQILKNRMLDAFSTLNQVEGHINALKNYVWKQAE